MIGVQTCALPIYTSLNCTMPELTNISVGSLPGTSELDGTTVWPLLAKKSRKDLRMSLTVKEGEKAGEKLEFEFMSKDW